MPGGLGAEGVIIAPQVHEVGRSQAAAQDDPLGLQAGEVRRVEVFAHGGAGVRVGEGAPAQGPAEGQLPLCVGDGGISGGLPCGDIRFRGAAPVRARTGRRPVFR